MTFTPKKPEEMRKLAEVARGNAWKVKNGANTHFFEKRIVTELRSCIAFTDEPEAAFIAAANPSQIIHFCDLIEAQAKEIVELRGACASLRSGLRKISASSSKKGAAKRFPNTYHGGFDAGCAWAADVAARRLLSPSDSGREGDEPG